MTRQSVPQHPNPGHEGGPLLQSGKLASSESSASEKAEDTQGRLSHHLRSPSAHPGALVGFVRAMDDPVLDYDSTCDYASTSSFEFQNGERGSVKSLVAPYLNKSAPSKWDDAEKWLVCQSLGEAPVKVRTRSGPLHGNGVVQSLIRGQHEWLTQSHPTSNGCEAHFASILRNGEETLLLVNEGDHHQNLKLVTMAHPGQLPSEWTNKMDVVKGHNFGFVPAPASPQKGSSADFYIDEPIDMKEVSITHEYNELFLKPITRTRKPTSDSLVSVPPYASPAPAVRSISMRDMGTEMTPIASQEPSRNGTPIRATTPTLHSPVSSSSSTTRRGSPTLASPIQASDNASIFDADGKQFKLSEMDIQAGMDRGTQILGSLVGDKVGMESWASKEEEDADASKLLKNIDLEEVKKNVLETRAVAWEEAEQSKLMARFKREEAKILAWENHEKAKAEAEMRRIEVKVEKMRSHAQESLMNKLAAARRKVEERLAKAEAKRCEQASKTAHRADYVRRTGRLPSSSFFSCGLCR